MVMCTCLIEYKPEYLMRCYDMLMQCFALANTRLLLCVLLLSVGGNRHAVWLVTATRSRDRAIELKAARDEAITKAAQEVL
jgi:hypothetical protein